MTLCDQLREAADVEQELRKALLRARLAAVDVHRVGEHLEGVEGDADRQTDLRYGEFKRKERREVLQRE